MTNNYKLNNSLLIFPKLAGHIKISDYFQPTYHLKEIRQSSLINEQPIGSQPQNIRNFQPQGNVPSHANLFQENSSSIVNELKIDVTQSQEHNLSQSNLLSQGKLLNPISSYLKNPLSTASVLANQENSSPPTPENPHQSQSSPPPQSQSNPLSQYPSYPPPELQRYPTITPTEENTKLPQSNQGPQVIQDLPPNQRYTIAQGNQQPIGQQQSGYGTCWQACCGVMAGICACLCLENCCGSN